IPNAAVYLDAGAVGGVTNQNGKYLFQGVGSGQTTVTVAAEGYDLKTYVRMDAQYMNFALKRTVGPEDLVTISVRVNGLLWYETGGMLGCGDDWQVFSYDGVNDPIVDLVVPKDRADMAVSAVVWDLDGEMSSIGYDFVGPYASQPAGYVDLWIWEPDAWWFTSPAGSIRVPGGNFDDSSVFYMMMVYAYDDIDFLIMLGLSVPTSPGYFYMEWAALGDYMESVVPGIQVYSAQDATGAFTMHYVRDWLADLPGGMYAELMDVPHLLYPADGATTTSTRPGFQFSSPLGADMLVLQVEDLTDGRTWSLVLPGNATSIILPDILETPVRTGHDYEWNVQGFRFPEFTYDEFRWDYLDAIQEDYSQAKARVLKVR
ncbi:MAG: hypothetical protein ABFS86_11185, partial [Planctomycetota bacterium]